MNLIQHRKIFYTISGALIIASIIAVVVFGLEWGIDFTGGSVLSISFQETGTTTAPTISEVIDSLRKAPALPENLTVHRIGENRFIIKAKEISEKEHQQILTTLSQVGKVEPGSESFQSIGPVIGKELAQKTKVVFSLALLSIILYIALAFRRVSRPVRSYIYGLASLLALFHDVLIPLGVLAVLGHYIGVEISIPIITAFLTIFGYSINDTVVVFDRLRENLIRTRGGSFEEVSDGAIKQTMKRSIYTSATTLAVLVALFLLGGETLRWFSLTLIMGISFGTYSSVFLAVPLLVTYQRIRHK